MKPCVLWVEDNADDVLLLRQSCGDLGLDIDLIVAANAVLAFQYMDSRSPYILSRSPPDLILVDLNLPGINGMVVLNEIRSHRDWKKAPCVVLTSSSNPKELEACKALGAVQCITKPGTYEGYMTVMTQLRRYLPGSGAYPTDPGGSTKSKTTKRGYGKVSEVTNKTLDELSKPKPPDTSAEAG